MKKIKTNKEYLTELQEISDSHSKKKEAIEYILKEGEEIRDKFKESARVFEITETINKMMLELEDLELKYDSILLEYKNNK